MNGNARKDMIRNKAIHKVGVILSEDKIRCRPMNALV